MIQFAAAKAAFGMVPKWVWAALAGAILFAFAVNWHSGKVRAFGNERYQAGYDAAKGEIEALRRQVNQRNAELAAALRSKSDEENRRIAADADNLRLRGAGKAACVARLPAAAGGHDEAGRPADAAGPEMPAGEWAAVPWGWLVGRAETHDLYRNEALSWREWHKAFSAEWEAYKAKADAVAERR